MVVPEVTSFYSSKSHHIDMFFYVLPQLLQSLFLALIVIFFCKIFELLLYLKVGNGSGLGD